MYGLPKNFDGSFLVGHTLEMVCFAQYQVNLHFDSKINIRIESSFSYKVEHPVKMPVQNSNLMELLGMTVTEVHGSEDGTLNLLFENGQLLKIYDTSKQFESYIITFEGKEIIV